MTNLVPAKPWLLLMALALAGCGESTDTASSSEGAGGAGPAAGVGGNPESASAVASGVGGGNGGGGGATPDPCAAPASIAMADLTGPLGNDVHLNTLAMDGSYAMTGGYTSGHLYRSDDGGQTWASLAPFGTATDDIVQMAAAGGGVFLAGTSESTAAAGYTGKVWRTDDGGASWSIAVSIPNAKEVDSVYLHSGVAVAATLPKTDLPLEIWRSGNGGVSWSGPVAKLSARQWIRKFAHGSGNIIVGISYGPSTPARVHRSLDGGASWESATLNLTAESSDVYALMTISDGILAGTHPEGRILKSDLSGQSWTERAHFRKAGDDATQVVAFTALGSATLAWVNPGGRIYCSADAGESWTIWPSVDPAYHYHDPLILDDGEILAIASPNDTTSGRARIFRLTKH